MIPLASALRSTLPASRYVRRNLSSDTIVNSSMRGIRRNHVEQAAYRRGKGLPGELRFCGDRLTRAAGVFSDLTRVCVVELAMWISGGFRTSPITPLPATAQVP